MGLPVKGALPLQLIGQKFVNTRSVRENARKEIPVCTCSYGIMFVWLKLVTAKIGSIKRSYGVKFEFEKLVTDKVRMQTVHMRKFVREKVRISNGS